MIMKGLINKRNTIKFVSSSAITVTLAAIRIYTSLPCSQNVANLMESMHPGVSGYAPGSAPALARTSTVSVRFDCEATCNAVLLL